MSIVSIIANDFLIVINIVTKTLYDAVFAARCYAIVGMSVCPSVRLIVCLSVTLVHCVNTNVNRFSKWNNTIITGQ